jgi:hypothetical protein
MRRQGASPDVVRQYHALCRAAGLTEVSQRGFFLAEVDAAGTHLHAMHDAVVGSETSSPSSASLRATKWTRYFNSSTLRRRGSLKSTLRRCMWS